MVKCSKCGAEIPDEAGFCPGCGAPKEQKQPVAQPMPPAPKKSSGSGVKGLIYTVTSPMMLTIGLFIGILVAWIIRLVGQFFVHAAINVVNLTFMTGIGGLLLFTGLLNDKYSKYIRVGLIVAGAVILSTNL